MADRSEVRFMQDGRASVIIRAPHCSKGTRLKTPAPPRLQGERIVLRGFTRTDRNALFALFSDSRVTRYWSHHAWTEITQAQRYLNGIARGWRDGSLQQWAIADLQTDQAIGSLTFYDIVPAHARAGIGYALQPDHWGKGLAAEAVDLALRHAFGNLGWMRIEADTDPDNAASIRLLERVGFQREGLARERYRLDMGELGQTQDSLLLGLLKRDFVPRG